MVKRTFFATVSFATVILATAFGFAVLAIHAQQPEPPAGLVARLSSPDMHMRHAALDGLIQVISEGQSLSFDPDYSTFLGPYLSGHRQQSEQITMGLIHLLEADVFSFRRSNAAPGTYTEDDSERYALAIQLVASFNDERAIPALVGSLPTGQMATDAVVKYGRRALGAVLAQLQDPDPYLHSSALDAAIVILREQGDASVWPQMFGLIGPALVDKEYLVRSAALRQMKELSKDPQYSQGLQAFIPALEAMAQTDPFHLSRYNDYPLRDRAAALLRDLRKP